MNLPDKEPDFRQEQAYKDGLAKYLKDQGPNPGKGFFGHWGWHSMKVNEFEKKYLAEKRKNRGQ